MIHIAVYCRVSTDKDEQSNSFAAQQRYFREFIERRDDWTLFAIYADEGITGTSTRKRAAFNRMIGDAYLGKFQLIVTKEVSRFSRNILDTIAFTRELKELGVGVLFMNDGINTLEPDAELRLSIMASIAQEESRKTSARVKWGQTRQMERGVVFGHSLLGYHVQNGVLTIEPNGAELVRLIFHQYGIEGKSAAAIARELNAADCRGHADRTAWSANRILKILKNEKYVGDLVQKKTFTPDYLTHAKKTNHGEEELVIIRDHHEPIIDHALWDTVQAELRRRRRQDHALSAATHYPFSGKIRCGVCGASFISRIKYCRDGSAYRRWGCRTAASGGVCTVSRMLRDDTAAMLVQLALQSLQIDRAKLIDKVTAIAMETLHVDTADGASDRLHAELLAVKKKKEGVLDAFFSGTITNEEMQVLKTRYDNALTELQTKIAQAAEEQNSLPSEETIRKTLADILQGDLASDALNRKLVEQITVFGDRHIELKLTGLTTVWHFTD